MKFKDFKFKEGNHFVAMEYYGLILNRTFLILVTNEYLIGLKVNGVVSAEGGGDPITSAITSSMAITNDLENPYSYIKSKYLSKLENLDIFSDDILQISGANFKIKRSHITQTIYDRRKKWGMGPYPHDGKVYVKTIDSKKREFIILGAQSGAEIESWLKR